MTEKQKWNCCVNTEEKKIFYSKEYLDRECVDCLLEEKNKEDREKRLEMKKNKYFRTCNPCFQTWKQKSLKEYPRLEYPVAVSNRLFETAEIGKDLPCQHCHLIEMGSMACYTEFCPECGKIPPNQHHMYSKKK